MAASPKSNQSTDVPTQVFEKFLESLKAAGVSDELTDRFRKTLLEERIFTENALKKAVFGEETSP